MHKWQWRESEFPPGVERKVALTFEFQIRMYTFCTISGVWRFLPLMSQMNSVGLKPHEINNLSKIHDMAFLWLFLYLKPNSFYLNKY